MNKQRSKRFKTWTSLLFVVVVLVWSFHATEFSLYRLINGFPEMLHFLRGFASPDLSLEFMGKVFRETILTVQLGIVGTVIAFLFALPLSFLAAENVVKNKYLRMLPRIFFNAVRSVDTLIFALIFVVAVGLGPFAGALALSLHSMGMLGKLFYESIEHVKYGPIEAMKAVGATKLEVVRWAIIPQALPFFVSFFLYRLELNVRVAVVLGLVGAGGIGQMLYNYINLHRFDRASVVIAVIFVLVVSIDGLSAYLRKMVK